MKRIFEITLVNQLGVPVIVEQVHAQDVHAACIIARATWGKLPVLRVRQLVELSIDSEKLTAYVERLEAQRDAR
jgi:hypothetical protein